MMCIKTVLHRTVQKFNIRSMDKPKDRIGVLRHTSKSIPDPTVDQNIFGTGVYASRSNGLHQIPLIRSRSADCCPLCIDPEIAVNDQTMSVLILHIIDSTRNHNLTLLIRVFLLILMGFINCLLKCLIIVFRCYRCTVIQYVELLFYICKVQSCTCGFRLSPGCLNGHRFLLFCRHCHLPV